MTWAISLLGFRRGAVLRRQHDHPGDLGALGGRGARDRLAGLHRPRAADHPAILTGLFFIQRRGTGTVGLFFGPVMVGWFGVLGPARRLESPTTRTCWPSTRSTPSTSSSPSGAGLPGAGLGGAGRHRRRGLAPTWATSAASRSARVVRLRHAGAGAQLFRPGALLLNEPAAIESPLLPSRPRTGRWSRW